MRGGGRMKDKVSEILHAGNTENNLNKAIALSDVLMSASTAENLPDDFSIFYVASELYTTANELREVYLKLLDALREQEQEQATA